MKERELRALLAEGVAMMEATYGDTEKMCAELERSGNATTLDDGSVSYGQPWNWLRKAKMECELKQARKP